MDPSGDFLPWAVSRIRNLRVPPSILGICGAGLLFIGMAAPFVAFSGGRDATYRNLIMAAPEGAWSVVVIVVIAVLCLGYRFHVATICMAVLVVLALTKLVSEVSTGKWSGLLGNPLSSGLHWLGWLDLLAGTALLIAPGVAGLRSESNANTLAARDPNPGMSQDAFFKFLCRQHVLGLVGGILLMAATLAPVNYSRSKWGSGSSNLLTVQPGAGLFLFAAAGLTFFLTGLQRFYDLMALGGFALLFTLVQLGMSLSEETLVHDPGSWEYYTGHFRQEPSRIGWSLATLAAAIIVSAAVVGLRSKSQRAAVSAV